MKLMHGVNPVKDTANIDIAIPEYAESQCIHSCKGEPLDGGKVRVQEN